MNHTVDAEGLATVASAKAQGALARGDTREAQQYSAEAARVFEQELSAAKDEQSRHLLRFFAATQYYRGGYYAKAQQLAKQIAVAKLPGNTRHLLPQFLKDVKTRSAPDYAAQIEDRVYKLWGVDFQQALAILAEHPFAFDPSVLALMRAVCFEAIGKFQSAARFYRKSAQYDPSNPEVYIRMKDLPSRLSAAGEFEKAWEYVKIQLEIFPNPISKLLASLFCYRDAWAAKNDEDRVRFIQEQSRFFNEAKAEFAAQPNPVKTNTGLVEVMLMGYRVQALSLYKQGLQEQAIVCCREAIDFAATMPQPWTLLGVVANDNAAIAIDAFKRGVELGDTTYVPYAGLAHFAMLEMNYKVAAEMALQALNRQDGLSDEVRSLLLQWQAISIIHLGGNPADAEALFRQALEAASDNEYAKHNLDNFLQSTSNIAGIPRQDRWNVPSAAVLSGYQPADWKVDWAPKNRPGMPSKEAVGV